ncbi:NADH:flavin oxidoreductase [Novosphingobium sp. B 225]|uniref:NADH:flavin oxidoreductase n=1 Tax=Novosphingobium sp. B 225 TaxID=1961849 RepID=UPI000B4BC7DF|nr:NADH:flavin oxidoreductase [Novosphingobium sp. B 225]
MTDMFAPLGLAHGPAMTNRFMLAPLTNLQSNPDGTLSDDEINWLVKRAEGGFGLVMTAAAFVDPQGIGFPGQLGIASDDHLPGLTRLAQALRAKGALSSVQLHHAGIRSPKEIVGTPVGPFADAETGARALTSAEVEQLRDSFIAAAVRAERAGFDGAEIHGAHGYVLAQFLDAENNTRDDGWGGDYAGRTRIIREVIDVVRAATGPQFQLGLRLSPERFGIQLGEAKRFAEEVMTAGQLDYLDMSLWDCFKLPNEEEFADRPLIEHFTALERGATRLGVAGKIMDAARVRDCLAAGADFVLLGRGAILHHDFPAQAKADPAFASAPTPVTRAHLLTEGLGPKFVDYMATWKGFVAG